MQSAHNDARCTRLKCTDTLFLSPTISKHIQVISAVLANDVFLVLGGFFAGHSFLVRLKAANRKSAFSSISNLKYGCIDVPRMYASRLVRILPTYGIGTFEPVI